MADLTNEGIEAANQLTLAHRKALAYNALRSGYGDAIAGDPDAAIKAQAYQQREQTNPLEVQQAQANLETSQLTNRDTAGTQQRMAAYRATQMLKSAAAEDGTIPADAYDKIVRPNAGLLGIDPEHIDQFGATLSQPGGAQHLDEIAQALIGPTKVTGAVSYGVGADGQPVAITKDQYGNIHQQGLGGTRTTSQQRADQGAENVQTGKFRAQTGRIAAVTGQFNAGVRANNSEFGAPGGAVAPGQAAPAPVATGAAPVSNPNALFYKLPPKGKQKAVSFASQISNGQTILSTTNQILDTVDKQIAPYTAGAGSLLKNLPGNAAADLKANLATLKAQGLTSWINSLKNSAGQTGIGRVLQSEAGAAMALMGNMEQDQSAKQLAFHAKLFRQTVNKLQQHSAQAFKAEYQIDPHEALGEPAPSAGGALPSGWKYLGPAK